MIEEYLNERETLLSIVLLIDIRHEPGENDKMMYNWIKHYGYDVIIVATKSDKLKRSQLPKHISMIRKGLGMEKDEILIPFSGETKQGKEELWQVIDDILSKVEYEDIEE